MEDFEYIESDYKPAIGDQIECLVDGVWRLGWVSDRCDADPGIGLAEWDDADGGIHQFRFAWIGFHYDQKVRNPMEAK